MNVIAGFDHVEVVLDDQHASCPPPASWRSTRTSRSHVGRCAGRWSARPARRACVPVARAGKLGRQLDALGLAAGERRGGLPQLDVAQTHVVAGFAACVRCADSAQKKSSASSTVISSTSCDVLALIAHLQRFAVIALAACTPRTARRYPAESASRSCSNAVAGAGFAAPAACTLKEKRFSL